MPKIFTIIRSILLPTTSFNERDVIILILGPAGSGKTSFINEVAQKDLFDVHHELAGGSTNVSYVLCTPKEEVARVVLVDTPPYPDEEGEKALFKWLSIKKRPPVKGIIYLHPITAIRGWPDETFRRLRAQGGHELVNAPTILVTTHWRKHEEDAKYLQKQEEIAKKWVSKIPEPPPVAYNESFDSARKILQDIMNAIEKRSQGTDQSITGTH